MAPLAPLATALVALRTYSYDQLISTSKTVINSASRSSYSSEYELCLHKLRNIYCLRTSNYTIFVCNLTIFVRAKIECAIRRSSNSKSTLRSSEQVKTGVVRVVHVLVRVLNGKNRCLWEKKGHSETLQKVSIWCLVSPKKSPINPPWE